MTDFIKGLLTGVTIGLFAGAVIGFFVAGLCWNGKENSMGEHNEKQ